MKANVILAIATVSLANLAMSADPFPAEIKGAPALEPKEVKTAGLPKSLQGGLVKAEVFVDGGGKLLEAVEVISLDLNADKDAEFLVIDPAFYTGGSVIHLFSAESDGCKTLGAIQGEFYLAEPVDGYVRIVSTARSCGDVYERRLAVFKDWAYQDVKTAEYQMKENGDLVFKKVIEP